MIYNFCIIGGGIVGLATAIALLEKNSGASLLLIEKEQVLALHQTSHNSGVIHAGIYYAPGSLKAKLCREGLDATREFCRTYGIPFEQCGKLIVATTSVEEERIDALYERAIANGLMLQRLSASQLRVCEPRITGTAALLSTETGIVDYRKIAIKMAEIIKMKGADIILGRSVKRIVEHENYVDIGVGDESFQAQQLVVCGGLQADRLARLAGLPVDFRVVPFRGEYFQLPPHKNAIVERLIYPAPDPSLPFLGVHFTRMIDGSVTVGPNAVISFSREGYSKFSLNIRDSADFMSFPGFWKLIWEYRRHAFHELKGSLWRLAYLAQCRKYCPELQLSDLLHYRSGIRAQVILASGSAVHDFLFRKSDRMLHVCNAPSPAATSALPIGRMISEAVLEI